jgi:chromosome segregation ATPase
LETAIQHHLEAAVIEDDGPIIRPVLEKVVSENLEATVTAKIEGMKERLAGLLAKMATDTAVLYLMETRRWSDEERATWRKIAVDHVRGRIAELQTDSAATQEREMLKRKVEELAEKVNRKDNELATRGSQHKREIQAMEDEVQQLRSVISWYKEMVTALEGEWEASAGLLGRRKTFRAAVADFERQSRRPPGA